MNADIQVTTKEIQVAGEKIVITILKMGQDETMTVADVAEMLAIPSGHIRKYISDHGLIVTQSSDVQLAQLKQQGVIPLNSARANLLPKATIQALVKIVNTPEAWAAYNQLWVDLQQPKQDVPDALAQFVTLVAEQTSTSIAALTTGIQALSREIASGPLRSEEISRLQRAIYDCAKRFSCAEGKIMGEVKTRYLPDGLINHRTWKEIPRTRLSEALEYLATTASIQYVSKTYKARK